MRTRSDSVPALSAGLEHTVLGRFLTDTFYGPLVFCGLIIVLAVPFALLPWRPDRYNKVPPPWGDRIAGGLLSGFGVATVAVILSIFVSAMFAPLLSYVGSPDPTAHAIVVAFGLITGGALFLLRKFHRAAYGVLEMLVAIVGFGAYPVAPRQDGEPQNLATAAWLLGIMTLIYLTVRGLDNVDVGLAEIRKRRGERRSEDVVDLDNRPEPNPDWAGRGS